MARADATRTTLYSGGVGSILVDAENIYFATYTPDGGPSGAASGQLMSMPKGGGPATVIGTDLRLSHGVLDLAQDDDFVFVVTFGGDLEAYDPAMQTGTEILAFPKRPATN